MKSCKKITAAVIAAVLVLSVFMCPAFAGIATAAEETTAVTLTPPDQSPEDLTYVDPTLETKPEINLSDIFTKDPDAPTGPNEAINEKISFFQKILNKINEFFNIILEYIQRLNDEILSKAKLG